MAETIIPLAEVAKHATKKDAWMIIDGKVYDVTEFLEDHPGGPEIMMEHVGAWSGSGGGGGGGRAGAGRVDDEGWLAARHAAPAGGQTTLCARDARHSQLPAAHAAARALRPGRSSAVRASTRACVSGHAPMLRVRCHSNGRARCGVFVSPHASHVLRLRPCGIVAWALVSPGPHRPLRRLTPHSPLSDSVFAGKDATQE